MKNTNRSKKEIKKISTSIPTADRGIELRKKKRFSSFLEAVMLVEHKGRGNLYKEDTQVFKDN